MKRTAFVTAGVIALGTAIVVGNLWGQTGGVAPKGPAPAVNPPAPVAGAKTRVGLLNLSHVIKNYEKFKMYQEELKATVKPFQDKDTNVKARMEKLAKDAQLPTTKEQAREKMQRDMKDLERQLEDNKIDAQKALGKKQEEQLRTLYMDVYRVVDRYAQAHGFDMVLHFNDVTTQQEYWSAQNIARKMQAGALVPMYMANGLDISNNVLATLNAPFQKGPATGAPR